MAVYPTALSPDRIRAHYEIGRAIDSEPPVVTLDVPAHGSVAEARHPTFSGTAGSAAGRLGNGDGAVYAGNDALGNAGADAERARSRAAHTRSMPRPPSAPGSTRLRREQNDGGGNTGLSSANTFSVDAPAPSTDRVLVGAGDIASCTESGDTATGALLASFPNAVVATIGDNAYPAGTAQQFSSLLRPDLGWREDANATVGRDA